jgi:hypothetical protein
LPSAPGIPGNHAGKLSEAFPIGLPAPRPIALTRFQSLGEIHRKPLRSATPHVFLPRVNRPSNP